MDGKPQAYIIVPFCKKNLLFSIFAALFSLVLTGCATVSTDIINRDYETYVKDVHEQLKSSPQMFKSGYYLQESVKRKILHESVQSIQKGDIETYELDLLRKDYLEYARALIELGQFQQASTVCDQGIQVGMVISKALSNQTKRAPVNAFSRMIATGIINTSILPHNDNDAFLRRLYLYKTYITWFTTGNKEKSFKMFEEFLEKAPLNEDRVFLLMDRGAFYDVIMGDYRKSVDEFMKAKEEIGKMHLLNTDMRYVYSLEVSTRISDIFVKLGDLDKAEKNMVEGDAKRKDLLYTVGGLIAGLQKSRISIIKSKMGALYALLRDFKRSKELFDESFEKVKDIDPNSSDMQYQRVLGTYYVNYGAYYLGLQGKYKEASEYVDKGIKYLKPYFLDAIENDPNIEKAYLFSGELHFLNGDNNKALEQVNNAVEFAKRYNNIVTQSVAYTLLGEINYANGLKTQARQAYESALKLAEKIESTENWKLFYGLGQVYEEEDINRAMKYYKKAIEEVEKLWQGRFKDTQKQVSFIDNRLVVFEPVIRILAKQGKAEEAIHYMERSKSRTFFETSVYYQGKAGDIRLSSEEMKKLDDIKTEISSVSGKMENLSDKVQDINKKLDDDVKLASKRGVEIKKGKTKTFENLAALSPVEKKKLESEKAQYEESLKEYKSRFNILTESESKLLSKSNTNLKDFLNVDPLRASQIKKILPKETALLEYYVGEKTVVGIVVTQKGLNIKELPVSAKQLKSDIMKFRETIEDIDYQYLNYGVTLYETLIQPFEKALTGYEKIVLIPHGVLHYLPFQALVVSKNSKGISPELLEKESILVAKLYSNSRGIKVKPRQSENKITKTGKIDIEEVRDQLEAVRSQINNERTMKGLGESRPLFLIDKYQVIYSPSATILDYTQKINSKKKDKLLGLGSPPAVDVKDLDLGVDSLEKLLSAKYEVQEVGTLFGSKNIYTDEAATETVVKNNSSLNDILLFSTHGILNRKDPLKSSIFFNKDKINDGRLTIPEIENLNINANIVALSACETGLVSGYEGISEDIYDAKFPYGDDLVGLQRAFMKSGAASVLSSLWSVADESTSTLMIDFFREFRDGKDKAAALQLSILKLMQSKKKWEHPYFWAPFILSGDWQ